MPPKHVARAHSPRDQGHPQDPTGLTAPLLSLMYSLWPALIVGWIWKAVPKHRVCFPWNRDIPPLRALTSTHHLRGIWAWMLPDLPPARHSLRLRAPALGPCPGGVPYSLLGLFLLFFFSFPPFSLLFSCSFFLFSWTCTSSSVLTCDRHRKMLLEKTKGVDMSQRTCGA